MKQADYQMGLFATPNPLRYWLFIQIIQTYKD
jgi:hypothetical protein